MSLSAATAAAGITLLVGVGTLVAANVLLKKKASAKSQAEPVKEEACYSLKTKSSADLQAEPVKEACYWAMVFGLIILFPAYSLLVCLASLTDTVVT